MSSRDDLDRVLRTGIVAILRAPSSEQLVNVARALYDGGIDVKDAGRYYRERRVSRGDRIYRGNDGRYYGRRSDGTTGLIVGAVAGGVLGNIIASGGSETLGTLIGAGVGAAIGSQVDKGEVRCR